MVWRFLTHYLFLALSFSAVTTAGGAPLPQSITNPELATDTLSLHLLERGYDYLSRRVYDSARVTYLKALHHARIVQRDDHIAQALNNLGVIYFQSGHLDSSIYYYDQAAGHYRRSQDSTMLSSVMVNLGILYKEKGLYEKSLGYLLEASHRLEKGPASTHLASAYNTMGNVYSRIGDLNSALNYHYKALEVRQTLKLDQAVSSSYNNIGNVYNALGLYDSALANYRRTLTIRRSFGDKGGEAVALNNIGEVMLRSGKLNEAESFLQQALAIRLSTNDRIGQINARINLADVHIQRGQINDADKELKVAEAMATSLQLLEQLKDIYNLRVVLHKKSNQPDAALAYSERLLVVKDSILNREKAQSLAEMQTRYESLKKEDRIALLEKEGLLRAVQLERKNLLVRMLAVAVVLVLVIVGLVYHNFRVVRRNKKHIELLLRELHHRVKNNLQILSSLLSLQSQQLTDDTAIRAVKSSESRINAMALIHRKLYTVDQNRTVDIKEYITELIQYLVYSYGYHEKNFKLDLEIKEISIDVDKAIPLGLILNELISNAFKHAYANQPNPRLAIDLGFPDVNALNIRIRDNGAGMPVVDEKQRKTFGMKIVNTLIKELKGSLNVNTDNGTTYELNIPI